MINEYYVFRDNEKHGPYSHTELMDMNLSVQDMILSPLADDWQEAADLPEFDEYFKSAGIYVPTVQNVAHFGWRLLAYVIDYALLFIGAAIFSALFGIIQRLTTGHIDDLSVINDIILRLVLVIVLLFYHAAFESTKLQGSIGKVICKLTVVTTTGQRLTFGHALQRNFSKLISSMICGLGFLAMLMSPMKQCWHDQIAKTYVIKKASY